MSVGILYDTVEQRVIGDCKTCQLTNDRVNFACYRHVINNYLADAPHLI